MSLTNPTDVITERRLSEFYEEILPYLGGTAEAGFTPVGTIIAVMGNTAPANYLACDGSVVNIADYPILADYFEAQFGTKNHFGGDGTTTFAVPDLRGEFLRGTGTNSHENQGDGANVGEHQDGTAIPNIGSASSGEKSVYGYGLTTPSLANNKDSEHTQSVAGFTAKGNLTFNANDNKTFYTSRPTNTSVLYCIATHNIYMNPANQYSTEEQVVGQWIDGKPLYQKTIIYNTEIMVTSTVQNVNIADVSSLNIDKMIYYTGNTLWDNNNVPYTLPFIMVLSSGTINTDVTLNDTKDTLRLRTYRSSGESSMNNTCVTIQYTKTTD